MSRRALAPLALATILIWVGGAAQAAVISLFDYGYNIDGVVSIPTLGDSVPAAADVSAFNATSGLGTTSVTVTGAGAHNVDFFVDLEIDKTANTYFNETGVATGTPASGQSWEIDEPGFVFGDIFTNFEFSTLDNTNAVPAGMPDDVSMAIGFDFVLAADETAAIDFVLATTAPESGFFLTHSDPDSIAGDLAAPNQVFFSALLNISGPLIQVPEPGSLALMTVGLLGFAAAGWRRRCCR